VVKETAQPHARDVDARLIDAALRGREQAFDSLVGPLIEPAFGLAYTLRRQPEEAEDAVQEACFKAWPKQRQLKDGRSIRPWFMSIVANQCRSARRARWWSTLRVPEVPERPADVEHAVVRRLDLARGFARLSAEDRLAVHLFFYLDLPLPEIALVMGLSHSAARARLYRAVKRLRPDVEPREVLP